MAGCCEHDNEKKIWFLKDGEFLDYLTDY